MEDRFVVGVGAELDPGDGKSHPATINNISKTTERLFLNRFQQFFMQSPNFNSHQSPYRPKHSTETALLCTLDKVFNLADNGKSTLLVSLDYSAAFDTILLLLLLLLNESY